MAIRHLYSVVMSLLVVLCGSSCRDQQLPPVQRFTYQIDSTIVVPPADSGANQDPVFEASFSAKGADKLKERSLTTEAIKDVNLDSAVMIQRDSIGFSWLSEVEIRIQASSLARRVIAEKGRVPADSLNKLKPAAGRTNLVSYFQRPAFGISVTTHQRRETTKAIPVFLTLYFSFRYEGN